MRTSSAVAAALLVSSTVAPVFALPIQGNEEMKARASLGSIANGATLGAAGLSIIGSLFPGLFGGNKREVEEFEARASLSSIANGATLGAAGLSIFGPLLSSLFGGNKRELTSDDMEQLNALLTSESLPLEARASLSSIANGATLGAAGLSIFGPLLSSLFGHNKRELTSDEMEQLNALLISESLPMEARASLGSIANGATLGAAGLSIIGSLFPGLFGGNKREVDELVDRASLSSIANGATLGAAGLSIFGPLLSSLFGGNKRELTSDDVEQLNALLTSESLPMEARASLSSIASGATLGAAGLSIFGPLLSSLFGGNKRELTSDDMEQLNALFASESLPLEARASLGSIANGATLGAAGLSIIGSLFPGLFGNKREFMGASIADLD